jgi:hypothetical protein
MEPILILMGSVFMESVFIEFIFMEFAFLESVFTGFVFMESGLIVPASTVTAEFSRYSA